MEEQDRNCWIPRNLTEDDVFKLGFGITLKIVDLPFLAAGGAYSYILTAAGAANPLLKVATCATIMSISYLISKFTIEDKPLPNVCVDGVVYTSHQVKYSKKRRELNVETTRKNNQG